MRDARTNLDDLSVNLDELLKSLMKWFRYEPLTDDHRVLNILLAILKVIYRYSLVWNIRKNPIEFNFPFFVEWSQSKFGPEAKRILGNQKYRNELNRLQSKFGEMAPSKQSLNEISDILNANTDDRRQENERLATFGARSIDRMNGNEDCDADSRTHCFTYMNAWEQPVASDLNTLKLLKTSLRANVDRAGIEHALQYFDVIVKDYPGEYFLQEPYLFVVRKREREWMGD